MIARRLPLAALALLLGLAPGALASTQLLQRISILHPPGWDAPVVARTSPGAVAADPLTTAALLPPSAPVWFDWAVSANPAIGGSWVDALLLDGEPLQRLPRWNGSFVSRVWYALDAGPAYMHGGRHTLTAITDEAGRFEDFTDRYDNRVDRQLIWTPEPWGSAGTTGSYDPPPLPATGGSRPSNHAYSIVTPASSWVIAMKPAFDYDLAVFDDFASSTAGLEHELVRSARSGDSLEVIVATAGALPATLYPCVERRANAGAGGYVLSSVDAAGRLDLDGDAFWGAESLYAFKMVKLYELQLQAGRTYPMSLWTRAGPDRVHFAVFPGAPGQVSRFDQALVRSQPVVGQDYDVAAFMPAADGRYLVLAYRDADQGDLVRYQLAVGSQAVGAGSVPAAEQALEVAPNPAAGAIELRFQLARPAAVRLDVLDLQGRLVRRLIDGTRPAGAIRTTWDRLDDSGRRVAPGLYWARLEREGRRQLARLSVLR